MIRNDYDNPDREKINYPIINRQYEKNLYEYVIDCFQSISSVLPEFQMVDSKFVSDFDKVNQSDYERTRSNRQVDKNQQYVYCKESRLGELTMTFEVHTDFQGEPVDLQYKVRLLVPIPDKDGYYLIKGIRYILQYQLTESATYTTTGSLVTKSLMPIKVRKRGISLRDTNNVVHDVSYAQLSVFEKYENFLYFYLAEMGWSNTLEFFDLGGIISAVPEHDGDPSCTYFKIGGNLTIKVKTSYLRSDYIQVMLGNICDVLTNRVSIEDLEDKDMWISKIGAFKINATKESRYELGTRYAILSKRMLDESTKGSLRLQDYNKGDFFKIIRWIVQNFKELWQKDNLDVLNKRLRCNELVAGLINTIISDKIKRFVNTTANTKEKLITKYNHFFTFRGNEIISMLHVSGLMKYDDVVNDMDFFSKLKITSKGPSAAGEKNDSRTVTAERRGLHPSQLGVFDINVCSSSDPGLTNVLSPFCETDGLYFKGAPPEPESFRYNFIKEFGNYDEENSPVVIIDPVKYNAVLNSVTDCHIRGLVMPGED